jgi:hypothetical protein
MSNDIELNPGPSNDSTTFLCVTYDNLNDSMVSWHCIICNHLNYSTILFDLHGISTSNTFEIDPNFNYDEHSIISITSTSSSVKPVHASTPINKRNAHSKSSTQSSQNKLPVHQTETTYC